MNLLIIFLIIIKTIFLLEFISLLKNKRKPTKGGVIICSIIFFSVLLQFFNKPVNIILFLELLFWLVFGILEFYKLKKSKIDL